MTKNLFTFFSISSLVILHWFVNNHTAESAISEEQIITEEDLKAIKDMSFACLDENIYIARIKPYFTAAGWSAVLKSVKELRKQIMLCCTCKKELKGDRLSCDSCLEWLHLCCTELKKTPTAGKWFCNNCYVNV